MAKAKNERPAVTTYADHEVIVPLLLSERRKIGWEIRYDNCVTKTTLGVWPVNTYFCGLTAHHLWANHLGGLAHGLKGTGRDAVSMTGGMDQWKALGLPIKK